MTLLGAIFLLLFTIGLTAGGRVGLLAAVSAGIPFSDSAAVVIAGLPIAPFYLGLLVYLPLAFLDSGVPRVGSSLPWLLGFWGIAITIIGPALFSGLPVVKSEMRQEHVWGSFWSIFELQYETSNVAQVGYLILNLALLMSLASSTDRKPWIPAVPAVVGTVVASLMFAFREIGIDWPRQLFANSGRVFASGSRFAGPFTEPSKLGVFALTSAALLLAILITRENRKSVRAALIVLIVADIFLIIESASLTALAGAAILGTAAATRTLYLALSRGAKIPTAALLLLPAAIVASPFVLNFAFGVIQYKFESLTSLRDRRWADAASLQVFLDSLTIGVGLGSNRASSLLFLLISQIGMVGTVLFLLLMARALHDGAGDVLRRPYAAGLVALLAASFVSLPDFVSPMMWLLAGFCWNAGRDAAGRGARADPSEREQREQGLGPRTSHGIEASRLKD